MWSLDPRWGKDVQVQNTKNGLKFEATSRIRDVIYPRVAEETALFGWYITFRVPAAPFTEYGLLPIRKLLFIEQELRAIAKRENRKEYIDKVIRISITRDAKDDLSSKFLFTTDTGNGPELVALKYFRHPASNANVSPSGDLFRIYGQADIDKTGMECRMAFSDSDAVEVTFAELRKIVENGHWPAQPDHSVTNGDHLRQKTGSEG